MNNIIRINPETREKYFAIVGKFYENLNLYVNIGGATVLCKLNGDDKLSLGDAFYGNVRFSRSGRIYLSNYSRVEHVSMRTNEHPGKGSSTQSQYQKIDAFLVKCKRSMYDAGLRAGTPEWDRQKREAAELYVAVFGGELHVSRDAAVWFK